MPFVVVLNYKLVNNIPSIIDRAIFAFSNELKPRNIETLIKFDLNLIIKVQTYQNNTIGLKDS